jgi:golgi phosphoprotein 3
MKLDTAEKFLLLAQHPDKGRFLAPGIYVTYGLIGALILDLSLKQKVTIEDEKLILKTRKRTADPIESEIISTLQKFERPLSVRRSINKLSRKEGKFKSILLTQMARKRILRIEFKTFLGLIKYRRHYLTDRKTRNELIQQLKNNLLHLKVISDEDAVIFGLIEACKLHKVLSSDKDEQKVIGKQLKEKLKENSVAANVDKTIRQIQAAVMGAVVAAAVTAGRGR